jgi:hypothetical protein
MEWMNHEQRTELLWMILMVFNVCFVGEQCNRSKHRQELASSFFGQRFMHLHVANHLVGICEQPKFWQQTKQEHFFLYC